MLFCKPIPVHYSGQFLYKQYDPDSGACIAFRSLELQNDLDLLYSWVNQPYSKRFWQLNGSRELLRTTYQSLEQNPDAHSFIGLLNDQPVGQVDLYNIAADELEGHIQYQPDDCGLHLLMMPPRESKKGLSFLMLRHFMSFYFSFPQAERLFAEPDKENAVANLLAKRTGFRFLKTIQLSYKTANLYCITKSQFQ